MERRLVIDSDLVPDFNIAEGYKKNVIVENLHKRVRFAGMIYVVRTIAAATAIEAPPPVNLTDTEGFSMSSAARFGI